MTAPHPTPVPLHHPTPGQRQLWSAVRARLSVDTPWLVAALFRTTPVHISPVHTSPVHTAQPAGADQALAVADRWGRVYLDFDAAAAAGIAAAATAVRAAVLDWVAGCTPEEGWFAHRLDDRFPAVGAAQADRAGRSAAAGMFGTPPPRFGTDEFDRWREWSQRVAGPPQVTWQQHLGASVRAAVATRSGYHRRTYTRPSRRPLPGVVLPSYRSPQVNVAILADISGSVAPDLPTVIAEITRITDAVGLGGGTVSVYCVDDEVAAVVELRHGVVNDLPLEPREGHLTDLRAGFTAIGRAARRADVVVALTDGLTQWPAHAAAAETIVALIGPGTVVDKAAEGVPAWATTLRITT